MNAKLVALATLLTGSGLAWGQDIVLKASFPYSNPESYIWSIFVPTPIDVNDDGVAEIPVYTPHGQELLDITDFQHFAPNGNCGIGYPATAVYYTAMRRSGVAEWIMTAGCYSDSDIIKIVDIASQEVLLEVDASGSIVPRSFLMDYDQDGLNDVIFRVNQTERQVYGIATGNPPIGPPQELDIQQVGEDYVITWSSVPDATAYRVEWSSALDGGVRFTRIGYTSSTTFTHRNQVGQERGFYRVLSEDNGTGVVRMVGSTTLGK
jgi:hypothetical protein